MVKRKLKGGGHFKQNKAKKAKKTGPALKDNKSKRFRHIARNQETEGVLNREIQAEQQRDKRQRPQQDESSEDSEHEADPFDQLLSVIAKSSKKITESAIESSSESEEELVEEEAEKVASGDDNNSEEDIETADEPSEHSDSTTSESEQEEEDSASIQTSDPFAIQFDHELSSELLDAIAGSEKSMETAQFDWPEMGTLVAIIPRGGKKAEMSKTSRLCDGEMVAASEGQIPQRVDVTNLESLYVKSQIRGNIESLTPFQGELFCMVNGYQDVYYPHRTEKNGEQIRQVYTLHVLNHVLKTRARILHHNARLAKAAEKSVILPDHFRDQGLVRPKVLIVLPFRESVLRMVNMLASLMGGPETIQNYRRFVDEFSGETLFFPKRNPKPEDYEQTFAGNIDDNFRLGIALTKKSAKLYTDYYNSDLIIASPLGLRLTIGAAGEKERDFDFLASIEILILDQVDIFYAQNWDHLVHLLDHLHLKPESTRNTDFSRVRTWCLSGLSKNYCQSLIFASHDLPEFRSIFNNRCLNYRGKIRTKNLILGGSIRHVSVTIPQIFQRIDVSSLEQSFDARFKYFVKTVLPQFKSASFAHCLIYVPSYFDFVRLRNYFKTEELSFVQISEYSPDDKVARARDMFFHGGAHFLLYSERAHFFKRTRIKGIRNIIMYQPPAWPHFYAEMINLMHETYQNPRTAIQISKNVTVLYTVYDLLQVANIVGSERAAKIANARKNTHMFMTNE